MGAKQPAETPMPVKRREGTGDKNTLLTDLEKVKKMESHLKELVCSFPQRAAGGDSQRWASWKPRPGEGRGDSGRSTRGGNSCMSRMSNLFYQWEVPRWRRGRLTLCTAFTFAGYSPVLRLPEG